MSQQSKEPHAWPASPVLWVGHYDGIKHDVTYRKEVANLVRVGFDVPATFGSIEPNEPKIEEAVELEIAVRA